MRAEESFAEQVERLDREADVEERRESWFLFFREAIAVCGGWRADPDYPYLPRPLTRRRGMELDLAADELGFPDVNAMVDKARHLYDRWRQVAT